MDRSIAFYVDQLGFKEHWRHEHEGKAIVAQVDRQDCELILSSQEPDRTGRGRMFISLDVAVLEAVRAEPCVPGCAMDQARPGRSRSLIHCSARGSRSARSGCCSRISWTVPSSW
jgi:catechol 2,3-dioxygenase-like lactoylglutathione lyase family enzyme